jgi:hypothetical protein
VGLACVVVNGDHYHPFSLNCQTLANPPNLLGCARKDKILKKPPVLAHTTRGVVVDADGKQVAVESSAGGSS